MFDPDASRWYTNPDAEPKAKEPSMDATGIQHDIGTRFDLIPPLALREIAKVLNYGATRYNDPERPWRSTIDKIDTYSHINHALDHVNNALTLREYTTGDSLVEELSHAACRILAALEQVLDEQR